MSDSHGFDRWEQTRRLGFWRFIGRHGALGWGLRTATFFAILMVPLTFFLDHSIRAALFVVPIAFALFPLGGLAWGALFWWIIDRRYKRHLQ